MTSHVSTTKLRPEDFICFGQLWTHIQLDALRRARLLLQGPATQNFFNIDPSPGTGKTAIAAALAAYACAQAPSAIVVIAVPFVRTARSFLQHIRALTAPGHDDWKSPEVVTLLGKQATCRWQAVRKSARGDEGSNNTSHADFTDRCVAARRKGTCAAFRACAHLDKTGFDLRDIENLGGDIYVVEEDGPRKAPTVARPCAYYNSRNQLLKSRSSEGQLAHGQVIVLTHARLQMMYRAEALSRRCAKALALPQPILPIARTSDQGPLTLSDIFPCDSPQFVCQSSTSDKAPVYLPLVTLIVDESHLLQNSLAQEVTPGKWSGTPWDQAHLVLLAHSLAAKSTECDDPDWVGRVSGFEYSWGLLWLASGGASKILAAAERLTQGYACDSKSFSTDRDHAVIAQKIVSIELPDQAATTLQPLVARLGLLTEDSSQARPLISAHSAVVELRESLRHAYTLLAPRVLLGFQTVVTLAKASSPASSGSRRPDGEDDREECDIQTDEEAVDSGGDGTPFSALRCVLALSEAIALVMAHLEAQAFPCRRSLTELVGTLALYEVRTSHQPGHWMTFCKRAEGIYLEGLFGRTGVVVGLSATPRGALSMQQYDLNFRSLYREDDTPHHFPEGLATIFTVYSDSALYNASPAAARELGRRLATQTSTNLTESLTSVIPTTVFRELLREESTPLPLAYRYSRICQRMWASEKDDPPRKMRCIDPDNGVRLNTRIVTTLARWSSDYAHTSFPHTFRLPAIIGANDQNKITIMAMTLFNIISLLAGANTVRQRPQGVVVFLTSIRQQQALAGELRQRFQVNWDYGTDPTPLSMRKDEIIWLLDSSAQGEGLLRLLKGEERTSPPNAVIVNFSYRDSRSATSLNHPPWVDTFIICGTQLAGGEFTTSLRASARAVDSEIAIPGHNLNGVQRFMRAAQPAFLGGMPASLSNQLRKTDTVSTEEEAASRMNEQLLRELEKATGCSGATALANTATQHAVEQDATLRQIAGRAFRWQPHSFVLHIAPGGEKDGDRVTQFSLNKTFSSATRYPSWIRHVTNVSLTEALAYGQLQQEALQFTRNLPQPQSQKPRPPRSAIVRVSKFSSAKAMIVEHDEALQYRNLQSTLKPVDCGELDT